MKNNMIKHALPGIILLAILGFCILIPEFFQVFNPVILWIGLITLGIPSLLASPIMFCLSKYKKSHFNALQTGLLLFAIHIPAFYILIETWLYFRPSDGPALGYMLMFYVFGAPYWLPFFIGWSWFSARKD